MPWPDDNVMFWKAFRVEEDVTIATEQYDWHGELTGYFLDEEQCFVPVQHERVAGIRYRVNAGLCELRTPNFEFASPRVSQQGVLTGHETRIGFVPNDPENALRRLLIADLAAGKIQETAPVPPDQFPNCSHIKFVIAFPRPWAALIGPMITRWKYEPLAGDKPFEVGIQLENLGDTKNVHAKKLETLGLDASQLAPMLPTFDRGILEIEFALRDLDRLFRLEQRANFGVFHSFIEDIAAMEKIREDSKRPSWRALARLAPMFLRRPLSDIANQVITQFGIQHGGAPVGFVREQDFQEHVTCLLRDEQQNHHLLMIGGQGRYNALQLSGEWRVRASAFDESRQWSLENLAYRLTSLVEAGFGLEAVSLANGYFEIIAKQMLASVFRSTPDLAQQAADGRLGHRRTLSVLKTLFASGPDNWPKEDLLGLLPQMEDVYDHRNDYMHDLSSRRHALGRSVDLDRDVTRLLTPLLPGRGTVAAVLDDVLREGPSLASPEVISEALSNIRGQVLQQCRLNG